MGSRVLEGSDGHVVGSSCWTRGQAAHPGSIGFGITAHLLEM